ncbi:MAG: DUF5057 domain-containing protein [Lachnospiraceae bacterium]|nr:DUF5057 domain-containing protein [Lachnospiraceae bacterium]
MKNKSRIRKSIIASGLALALVGSVVAVDLSKNSTEVAAVQNVFQPIKGYVTSGLSILEITPTAQDTEFGYFVDKYDRNTAREVKNVSYGHVHEKVFDEIASSATDTAAAKAQQEVDSLKATIDAILASGGTVTAELLVQNSTCAGYYQAYCDAVDAHNASNPWWTFTKATEAQYWANTNMGNGGNTMTGVYPGQWNSYDIYLDAVANAGPTVTAFYADPDAFYTNLYNTLYTQYVNDATNSQPDYLLAARMRNYGLIKPVGASIMTQNGSLSEYPFYDTEDKGIFGNVQSNDFVEINLSSGKVVPGHYEMVEAGGVGGYSLKSGTDSDGNAYRYIIATGEETLPADSYSSVGGAQITSLEANYIYKVTTYTTTVSGNTLSSYVYSQVTTNSGLPEGIVQNASGTVKFVYLPNKSDIYYGYEATNLFHLKPDNRYYHADNWIKEYILGNSENKTNVTYKNMTIDEINADPGAIANYDLIYFSGTADDYKSTTINQDFIKNMYNQCYANHKAVIMDFLLYNADDGLNDLDKLCLLLWQQNQAAVSQMADASGFFITQAGDPAKAGSNTDESKDKQVIDNVAGLLGTAGVFTALQGTVMSGYNGTFAVNNVYVYDHHYDDFQSSRLSQFQINARDNFANGDLASAYKTSVNAVGFQAVLAYIKYNNQSITTGLMSDNYVTPAIAIQYILSYRGEDLSLSKSLYTVLEIEPTKEFRFNSTEESKEYTLETAAVKAQRDSFISTCLSESTVTSGSQDFITFVSMTIDEFNTIQTDPLTEYDVIYFGAEHSKYYNNQVGTAAKAVTGEIQTGDASFPIYNERMSMNGNVYYSYGDETGITTVDDRYSSRDLTRAKLLSMQNYLKKNGLIVVDDELLLTKVKGNISLSAVNPTKVDAAEGSNTYFDNGRLDYSSNMFELLAYSLGYVYDSANDRYTTDGGTRYVNLISEGDLVNGIYLKSDITAYLNRERITLTISDQPSSYIVDTTTGLPSYVDADADGNYYLTYDFIINNNASASEISDFYAVHFYQDSNADGRFGPTEEKFDYKITKMADGGEASSTTDLTGVTSYALNGGTAYELKREISADEGGFIDWCLEIVKTSDPNVYTRYVGNTATKPSNEKYINILQIKPDDTAAVTVDLENAETTNPELFELLNKESVTDQYVITARSITIGGFVTMAEGYYSSYRGSFSTEEEMWTEFYATFARNIRQTDGTYVKEDPMNVNMIVLGFGGTDDWGTLNSDIAIRALEFYMDSNKPLLTSRHFIGKNADLAANKAGYLRYYFGQDRYGYTFPTYRTLGLDYFGSIYYRSESDAVRDTYFAAREKASHGIAYFPDGSAKLRAYITPVGYTNTILSEVRPQDKQSFIPNTDVDQLYAGNDPTATTALTYADNMNDGQIAHYPFDIPTSVKLSKTTAEYYQADLDTDSDADGNSDVVVWYTLGANEAASNDDIYSATPGDGINNYYVYNYGNVTYTGFGRNKDKGVTGGTITTEENKLFVNTLIAAYEAGLVNPTVSYYETSDPNSDMIDAIAVPYDKNVTNPTGSTSVTDSSVLKDDEGNYMYKFVDPNGSTNATVIAQGTKTYFKVLDSNYVHGEKHCKVYFYVEVDGKPGDVVELPDGKRAVAMQIQLNDNSVVNVARVALDIYKYDFSSKLGTTPAQNSELSSTPVLDLGTMYGIYVPMSYLNNEGYANIYIQADTFYTAVSATTGQNVIRPLGTAYDYLSLIKQELLLLD